MDKPIRLGVSSCLLGLPVRYDGGHKHDHFLTDVLGRFVEFVPVCPEVEVGLGVPREAMRLVLDPEHPDQPRLVTRRTSIDHTGRMLAWAARRAEELAVHDLSGFIFKAKSPSSGMAAVKLYGPDGTVRAKTSGLFARAFMERWPLLPVEDEGRLHDMGLRENFIERVFARRRWQDFLLAPTPAGLVDFHTRHKLLIMSHSPAHYRKLGAMVAGAGKPDEAGFGALVREYELLFTEALRLMATERKHRDVLTHILGYFKKALALEEKQEFLELIAEYARGDVPLIVPITLANHYVRKYGQEYLAAQYYLHPHPVELKLRNHA